jgi:hypothetical protein
MNQTQEIREWVQRHLAVSPRGAQQRLCQLAGITPPVITRLLVGENIRMSTLTRLLKARQVLEGTAPPKLEEPAPVVAGPREGVVLRTDSAGNFSLTVGGLELLVEKCTLMIEDNRIQMRLVTKPLEWSTDCRVDSGSISFDHVAAKTVAAVMATDEEAARTALDEQYRKEIGHVVPPQADQPVA